VRQRYAKLRDKPVQRDRGPAEPERDGFRWRELSGDVKQTRIEFGWRTKPMLHDDTPALDVLSVVLGQGRASRLYRQVRDAGLASVASAHHYTPTELGVFGVTAEAEPADTRGALAAIFKTIEATRQNITYDEVSRAQSIVEARMLRGLETMEGQAHFIAEWQSVGDWRLGLDYLEQVMSLQPAQLMAVAERYLNVDRAAVLAYRPASAAPIANDAADVRQWLTT
jgi:zinc protease